MNNIKFLWTHTKKLKQVDMYREINRHIEQDIIAKNIFKDIKRSLCITAYFKMFVTNVSK